VEVNSVTVAVPVLNGGARFRKLLDAVGRQANTHGVEFELLIVDSGSTDGSVEAARAAGARVIEIDKRDFQHGRTRNHAVEQARGDVVALLTDDAVPAGEHWLDAIVEGFALAPDVALVFGPQLPVPEHPHFVRRELRDHFRTWGGGGQPVVQRMPADRAEYEADPGAYTFFSDANGALAKWAWAEHPYKEVPYAEDQLLGREMIEAGHAKAFHPGAAVVHSHYDGVIGSFRRYFDDYRGLLEVTGYRSPHGLRSGLRTTAGLTRQDREMLREEGVGGAALLALTLASLRHHGLRVTAEMLAARADRLPDALTRRLSQEGRAGVEAQRG
jgi:rhamnosyltransferase